MNAAPINMLDYHYVFFLLEKHFLNDSSVEGATF
jgi:hypothetical protein